MAACSRNCKSWYLAKDAKEHSEAGNVGCGRSAKPQFGLNAMETSKNLGLGPNRNWAQKANSGSGVIPETNNLENSLSQLFFIAIICVVRYYWVCLYHCFVETAWPYICSALLWDMRDSQKCCLTLRFGLLNPITGPFPPTLHGQFSPTPWVILWNELIRAPHNVLCVQFHLVLTKTVN